MLTLLLKWSEIIIYDLVRKCVKLSPFFWTIFILNLAIYYIIFHMRRKVLNILEWGGGKVQNIGGGGANFSLAVN